MDRHVFAVNGVNKLRSLIERCYSGLALHALIPMGSFFLELGAVWFVRGDLLEVGLFGSDLPESKCLLVGNLLVSAGLACFRT